MFTSIKTLAKAIGTDYATAREIAWAAEARIARIDGTEVIRREEADALLSIHA